MSDQKKPESVSDDDLDAVQGGITLDNGIKRGSNITLDNGIKRQGIIWADSTGGDGVKKPSLNMEVVNEDE